MRIRPSLESRTSFARVAYRQWLVGCVALAAALAAAACNSGDSIIPAAPAVVRIEIGTNEVGVVSVPLRGTTTVQILPRDINGRFVPNTPPPTLVSRDTTVVVVDPGLVVRAVGEGATTLIATLVVDGRTFRDSARVGVVRTLIGR